MREGERNCVAVEILMFFKIFFFVKLNYKGLIIEKRSGLWGNNLSSQRLIPDMAVCSAVDDTCYVGWSKTIINGSRCG